jgi:hypothetical protein
MTDRKTDLDALVQETMAITKSIRVEPPISERENSTARFELQGAPTTPRSGQGGIRDVPAEKDTGAVVTERPMADAPRKPIIGKPVDGKRVHRGDPRAEELNSVRLALATFALKLDAFEARLKLRRGQTRKHATEPDLAPGAAAVADVPQAKPDHAGR